MPVCKWQIEPRNLVCSGSTPDSGHYPTDFTDISNEICSNLVRQLSSLSKHVQDLFRELNSQANDICLRSLRLNSKVNDLKEQCNRLNPTVDKGLIFCIKHFKNFHSIPFHVHPIKIIVKHGIHNINKPRSINLYGTNT